MPVSSILKYFQSGSLSPMDMKQQNELRNVFICYSNKFSLLFLSSCSSCALSFNPSLPFQRNAGRCWVWIPFWLSRRKVDVMLFLFKPSLNLKNFSACLLISNLKLWHNFIQKMQLDPCRNDCMPSWLRLAFWDCIGGAFSDSICVFASLQKVEIGECRCLLIQGV